MVTADFLCHGRLCRDEAASCSEKAYERLRVTDAQKLLLFDNDLAVRAYAQEVRG